MTTVNETFVEFPIEPKDQKGNSVPFEKLQLSVSGPHEVHKAELKKKDQKIFVSFYTTKTGAYTVTVKHSGQEIQNSPMTVNVKVKEAGEEQKPVELPVAPPPVQGGTHPVRFQVDAKDQDGKVITSTSDIEISISGPEKVDGVNASLNSGKFLFVFETSLFTGDFVVSVKHKGQDIQRSPFTISLAPHKGEGPAKEVAVLED